MVWRPIRYVICDSPRRSARRFYAPLRNRAEITVRMCERNPDPVWFSYMPGLKLSSIMNIAFNSNCGMLENGLMLPRYEYQKKNQLTVCLRTFRDKCLFSHDVWYSNEDVIFCKKKLTQAFYIWDGIFQEIMATNNYIKSSNDLLISMNIKKRYN